MLIAIANANAQMHVAQFNGITHSTRQGRSLDKLAVVRIRWESGLIHACWLAALVDWGEDDR